jgi:hypothetical protein
VRLAISTGRVLREYRVTGDNNWAHTDYIYGLGRALVVEAPGAEGGRNHLHHDHLGTVRQITNEFGVHLEYHAYYPFGEEGSYVGARL